VTHFEFGTFYMLQMSLRQRIYLILAALVAITFLGGLVLVWYTYRMEGILANIAEKHMAAFEAAEALEDALINQKGFVSYYFIDRDPTWLTQLSTYRKVFRDRLATARKLVDSARQQTALDQIEKEYNAYVTKKDQVIDLYNQGNIATGTELHQQVRIHFDKVLELCESYKDIYREEILQARRDSHRQAIQLRIMAAAAMVSASVLMVLLAFVLINQILRPVRRLTAEAARQSEAEGEGNEVKALSRRVRGLIEDVDLTHSELAKSREHLLQAEKMALVGKLAAGMAHSIRNPFTSVKMRLFSLSRSLNLSETQKEDFDVISEEIRHMDTIVQNFLEFSRPPKLKMQSISPSQVVDLALKLLAYRLQSYDVQLILDRSAPLPEVQADPEQLKEVLVNIIVNACEAMQRGGTITIREEEVFEPSGRHLGVVCIRDTGPGIPHAIQSKIFQPFFTTKEDGTGLGLSIASRIIEDHRGKLEAYSQDGNGTTFTLTLPIEEPIDEQEHHSRR
jgi:signal transduction histidine kinase